MSQREEFLSFSIPGPGGSDHAQAMQQMHAWVNDRLARGGRVKHLLQTSAGAGSERSRDISTQITVIVEFPEHA